MFLSRSGEHNNLYTAHLSISEAALMSDHQVHP